MTSNRSLHVARFGGLRTHEMSSLFRRLGLIPRTSASKGFELGSICTARHIGERSVLVYICLLTILIEHRRSMSVVLGSLHRVRQTNSRVEQQWERACGGPGYEANGVRAAKDICKCRTTLASGFLLTTQQAYRLVPLSLSGGPHRSWPSSSEPE